MRIRRRTAPGVVRRYLSSVPAMRRTTASMSAPSRSTSSAYRPCDAVVADAHDDDATLVKRRAVRLGSGPVDLHEDGVAVDRRPADLCLEVRDAFEQRGPVGAHLLDPLEGAGREQRLFAAVVLVKAGEQCLQVVRVLRSGKPVDHGPGVAHRTSIRRAWRRDNGSGRLPLGASRITDRNPGGSVIRAPERVLLFLTRSSRRVTRRFSREAQLGLGRPPTVI
jgi:hypothetical protein